MNLLCLGQSNFGNHLERKTRSDVGAWIDWIERPTNGKLRRPLIDPIPTCSGAGGSIWPSFSDHLQIPDLGLIVFAVGGSSILDWSEGEPFKILSTTLLSSLRDREVTPSLVIWAQGEKDNYINTDTDLYTAAHAVFREKIMEYFPNIVFLINICSFRNGKVSGAVREAQMQIAHSSSNCYLGIDMDALGKEYRVDGTHFNYEGQREIACRLSDRVAEFICT